MKEKVLGINMRKVIVLLLCLIFIIPPVSASDGGENKEFDIEGTQISAIDIPSTSTDGENFIITLTLNEENNVTNVAWTWQICLNSGVCLAPTPEDLTSSDDGKTWTTSMTPVDDHSYINFRITLDFEDGNSTTYPESGWGGKVWSDCWISGDETGGDGCNSEGGFLGLPGFTAIVAITVLGVVAIVTMNRRQ